MSLTNIYIAKQLGYESTCDLEYVREWAYVYFVKPVTGNCTLVSKRAIAAVKASYEVTKVVAKPVLKPKPKTVIKPIVRRNPVIVPVEKHECEFYRVVKTWDNKSSFSGGRVISVLVQPVDYSETPFWESVMLSQSIERDDILKRGLGRHFVKANLSYSQARLQCA